MFLNGTPSSTTTKPTSLPVSLFVLSLRFSIYTKKEKKFHVTSSNFIQQYIFSFILYFAYIFSLKKFLW
jgi:hypothetical protein